MTNRISGVNPPVIQTSPCVTEGIEDSEGLRRDLKGNGKSCREPAAKTADRNPPARSQTDQPPTPLEHARNSLVEAARVAGDSAKPEWQTGVFHFVRLLRAHPGIFEHKAIDVLKWLDKNKLKWEAAFRIGRADYEAEFVDTWDRVRLLPGADPITSALEYSKLHRLGLPPKIAEERVESYRDFVSLCGWLCVTVGKKRIAVPCREIAAALRCSSMTVSRFRKQAQQDGILKLVKRHHRSVGGEPGEATQFRFAVEWWPILKERFPED